MPGPKLNEHPVLRRRPNSRAEAVKEITPSARAVARYVRISPYKMRAVLDLVRGHDAERAQDILRFCERDAAIVVGKALASAMSNADRNNAIPPDELYVSACFADEGPTLKRWRPRARGRATKIRKRTCHVTVIVSRLPEKELQHRRDHAPASDERRRRRAGQETAEQQQANRSRRVRGQKASAPATAAEEAPEVIDDLPETPDVGAAVEEALETPEVTDVAEAPVAEEPEATDTAEVADDAPATAETTEKKDEE